MPLTNHAWDLTDGTGWTPVAPSIGTEYEFLPGGLHLKTGETLAYVLSPPLDASAWARIHDFEFTYEESADGSGEYRHQILVSFDDGATFFGPGSNRLLAGATVGWVLEQLRTWREWLSAAEVAAFSVPNVRVLVAMIRSDPAHDGILATLSVNEGTTENVDLAGDPLELEPDEGDPLPTFGPSSGTTYSGANPDWPLEMTIEAPVHDARYESGHVASYAHGTKLREVYDCRFGGRVDDVATGTTEATDLIAFLRDHVAVSFEWEPPGSGATRTFVSSDPRVEVRAQMGSGRRVVDVFAKWTEVV